MATLQTLLFILQVLVAIALIAFILVQHGKGADVGATFGSGASATVFGSSGSGNFMTKATTVLVAIFLANSLALSYIATQLTVEDKSLMQQEQTVPMKEGPVSTPPKTGLPEAPVKTQPTGSGNTGSDIPAVPKN